ncbi:hypothetical protein [Nostoc sp.]|uniref:hypothetical protein n=1 Tax=Nostoc sp. TaxID=1180 RepID=UPI002FF5B984
MKSLLIPVENLQPSDRTAMYALLQNHFQGITWDGFQIDLERKNWVLLFVLQVVLEGWGLSHYRRLAKECRYPVLAELFSSFLQSESRHHATGTTLFNQITVSALSQTTILDVLAQFLFMVQVGPQSLLAAIEQVKGHLTRSQKIQILQELDTETHSGTRLQILRSLMGIKSTQSILQTLEERGAFEPLPAHQCVY